MFERIFFQQQLEEEILPFWQKQLDAENGGAYGLHDHLSRTDKAAPKGGVMMARFLWAFSRAYRQLHHSDLKQAATQMYRFVASSILDRQYGGAYWSVTSEGSALNDIKHLYAQSFVLYGLSEYASIQPDSNALDQAIALYRLIEENCYLEHENGYWEEFSRDWQPKKISQVGSKDPELYFTTNTHLHLLEAYTNLYRIWPDVQLKEKIVNLLHLFTDKVYDPEGYCQTEFNRRWQPLKREVSFGHDIETSWLLNETLDICQITDKKINRMTQSLAEFTHLHGRDSQGVLNNHWDFTSKDETKVWWVEAEAVIGFYNAFQKTGEKKFSQASQTVWEYIQQYFIDPRPNSEWFSRLDPHNQVLSSLSQHGTTPEPISDSWKGPYHTIRMYLEMMNRLGGQEAHD